MSTKDLSLTKSNFGRKGWGILIIAFFSILLMSSIIYDSLNVTIAVFAEKFGMANPAPLYIFSTIAAWISVLGAVLWGAICTKKTIKFAWSASLFLGSVMCVLWGFAPSPVVYFLSLALASVAGMGFAYIANLNVISNWFPKKKGLAMGWVTIAFPLSAVLTVPIMSNVVKTSGLTGIYAIYAVATFALGVIVAVFVQDYPEQSGAFPDNDRNYDPGEMRKQLQAGLEYQKISAWQPKRLLRTANVHKIAVSLGIMELMSLGIMTNFMPRMMQIGFKEGQIIPMLMMAGMIAMFGSYLCGILDAKVGPKKAVIITQLFGLASLVLNLVGGYLKVAGQDAVAIALMFVAQPFLGIMLGGSANFLVSLTTTIWGRYDFNMAYRVLKPLIAVIGALGITIVGGLGNTVGYSYSYLVLAVLGFIALVLLFAIDDSYVGFAENAVAEREKAKERA